MNLIVEEKRKSFIEKANSIIRNKNNIALLGALTIGGLVGLVTMCGYFFRLLQPNA